MPQQVARMAGVIVVCIALILVWVAAILVARSLLGSGSLSRGSHGAQVRSQGGGGSNRDHLADLAGAKPVLDHSLTVRQSDPYPERPEWSTKRQE